MLREVMLETGTTQSELLAVASEADLVAVDTDASALRLGLARIFG